MNLRYMFFRVKLAFGFVVNVFIRNFRLAYVKREIYHRILFSTNHCSLFTKKY